MQKSKMVIAALMLTVTAMLAVGCTKPDEPGNCGNGGNNGGGNGGDTPVSYVISVSANPTDGGSVAGGGTFQENETCTVSATANTDYLFANWTENDSVVSTGASYTFAVTGNRNLQACFIMEYVDLGLPSGLLWATCNVGADTPEEYGDYFSWGETSPKDTYNWTTYKYCNGEYDKLTKYCSYSIYGDNGFTDDLTTLLPEDDAATANWGNGWRMPTKEEFEELYNNTTVTWTTQNDVNGRLFTASNGNSLFLPAAGNRWDDELSDAVSGGYYWSSSLYTSLPYDAGRFYFNSADISVSNYYYARSCGFAVRPVRSVRQN